MDQVLTYLPIDSSIKVIATSDVEDGYLKKSMLPIYAAAVETGMLLMVWIPFQCY